MVVIRKATQEDLPSITEIYNNAVLNSTVTFDTVPKTIEDQKRWFKKHTVKYPVFVAEYKNDVIGWAALSKWSEKPAYSKTAEISLYVKKGYRRAGTGKKLLQTILSNGKDNGIHSVIARVVLENETALNFFKPSGFETIGIMKDAGFKFGKFIDVCLMQIILL